MAFNAILTKIVQIFYYFKATAFKTNFVKATATANEVYGSKPNTYEG